MNIKFWMAGFLVIPKVYAVIASPFSKVKIMPKNFVSKDDLAIDNLHDL